MDSESLSFGPSSFRAIGLQSQRSNDNGRTFKAGNYDIKVPNVPKGHSVVVKRARVEPLASTCRKSTARSEVGEDYTRLQDKDITRLWNACSIQIKSGSGGVFGLHFGYGPDLEDSGSLVIVDLQLASPRVLPTLRQGDSRRRKGEQLSTWWIKILQDVLGVSEMYRWLQGDGTERWTLNLPIT